MIRPPAALNPYWLDQLDIVANWADLRADRAEEISVQLTPPIAFWSTILNLHPERRKWTLELVFAALRLANHVEMRFKHALACRRAVEMSPQIQPMILTPGHGSLPSGHATEAFIVAFVLWKLILVNEPAKSTEWLEQLMRQAARVAINRTVAGVHFPVDSAAGQLLGLTLGAYFWRRATQPVAFNGWQFDGTKFPSTSDFNWRSQFNATNDAQTATASGSAAPINLGGAAPQPLATAPLLAQLWTWAAAEWP
jgi:membrane-associated phospholipid phosphatase